MSKLIKTGSKLHARNAYGVRTYPTEVPYHGPAHRSSRTVQYKGSEGTLTQPRVELLASRLAHTVNNVSGSNRPHGLPRLSAAAASSTLAFEWATCFNFVSEASQGRPFRMRSSGFSGEALARALLGAASASIRSLPRPTHADRGWWRKYHVLGNVRQRRALPRCGAAGAISARQGPRFAFKKSSLTTHSTRANVVWFGG